MNNYDIVIICNRIRTPDGTVITSQHVHDYVTHQDANGFEYTVDGGTQYLRRSWSPGAPPAEEISVYSNHIHQEIREVFKWGTRGVSGDQPLAWVTLVEMSTEHITAILETQNQISKHVRKIFEDEIKFRKLIQVNKQIQKIYKDKPV